MTAFLSSYFKTKKALKEMKGKQIGYVIDPSPFEFKTLDNFKGAIVGPSDTERNWYAQIVVENGILKSIK